MATATSAGVDYTTPPNVTGSGSSNNSGSATKVGTTSLLKNVAVSKDTTGIVGSTVIDGDYTDKAISGGTIAHNHTKPIAGRVTTEIAGVDSTALSTNSNNPSQLRSINKRESYKVTKTSTGFRSGALDLHTGAYTTYGSYSRSGSTVTVTAPHHGLTTNDYVKLDFTSGAATDGRFQVTVTDANIFTVTHGSSGSTSGNVTVVGPAYATETVNTDTAATVSRDAPGDLVFRTGAKLPVRNRDYSPKYG